MRVTEKEKNFYNILKEFIKENKDRLLDNYNLICLCQEHHKQAEIGKIDRDYLYQLAREREDI